MCPRLLSGLMNQLEPLPEPGPEPSSSVDSTIFRMPALLAAIALAGVTEVLPRTIVIEAELIISASAGVNEIESPACISPIEALLAADALAGDRLRLPLTAPAIDAETLLEAIAGVTVTPPRSTDTEAEDAAEALAGDTDVLPKTILGLVAALVELASPGSTVAPPPLAAGS